MLKKDLENENEKLKQEIQKLKIENEKLSNIYVTCTKQYIQVVYTFF